MIEASRGGPGSRDLNSSLDDSTPGCLEESDLIRVDVSGDAARISHKVEAWNEQVSREGWSIKMPGGFAERPALLRGYEVLQHSGALIVGMSLGNSYFSSENITRLFRFLQTLDLEVYLVVMDKPSEHNYRALGYSENRIVEEIKKKSAEIFRAIQGALEKVDNPGERFHILSWDTIREHKDYLHARQTLESLYSSNEDFRNELRSAVSAYLTPKLDGASMTAEKQISADRYLLEELSFLICSRELLGLEESAYLYHREWPIFERLVSGIYDRSLASRLGFVELGVQSSVD